MTFKRWWQKSTADQKRALAAHLGVTWNYLWMLQAEYRGRKMPPALLRKIAVYTGQVNAPR